MRLDPIRIYTVVSWKMFLNWEVMLSVRLASKTNGRQVEKS